MNADDRIRRPPNMTKSEVAEWFLSRADWEGTCLVSRVKPHLKHGYPRVFYQGKPYLLHRFVWEVKNGRPIPPGKVIRHRCDRTSCINPKHLQLGTQADNVRDMVRRGRQRGAVGEDNPARKLTDSKVRRIRRMYATGNWTQSDLGRKFGVHQSIIGHVVNFETWLHVA